MFKKTCLQLVKTFLLLKCKKDAAQTFISCPRHQEERSNNKAHNHLNKSVLVRAKCKMRLQTDAPAPIVMHSAQPRKRSYESSTSRSVHFDVKEQTPAVPNVPKFAMFGMPIMLTSPTLQVNDNNYTHTPRLLRDVPSVSATDEDIQKGDAEGVTDDAGNDNNNNNNHDDDDDDDDNDDNDDDDDNQEIDANSEEEEEENDSDSSSVSDVEDDDGVSKDSDVVEPGTETAYPALREVVLPEAREWWLSMKEEVRAKRATDTLRTSGAVPPNHRYVHITKLVVHPLVVVEPPVSELKQNTEQNEADEHVLRPSKKARMHTDTHATLPSTLPPPPSPPQRINKLKAKSRQTRPFDLVLCYQLGQLPEQRIARLNPAQQQFEVALDIYLPILIDDIATPLRFWLRRHPDDLFDMPAVANPFHAEVHGFTVRQTPAEVNRLVSEQTEASARLAAKLAEAYAAKQRAHQLDLAQLWVARYEDEENRPNRKQLETWLNATTSVDFPDTRLARLLQCITENKNEYLFVVDSGWMKNGRAHATSDLTFLYNSLFCPYTDTSRELLQRYGLMCRVRAQAADHFIFHLPMIPLNDSSFASGLTVDLFTILQKQGTEMLSPL